MNLINSRFENLSRSKEKALVSYMLAGFPDMNTSMAAFRTILENGTDILEIGFPFSDPVADGPTIQGAHQKALEAGVCSKDVFNISSNLKRDFPDRPLVLMTYYNPVFRIGIGEFCKMASENGIDGFIVPDLPPEECDELKEEMVKHNLSLILLASPTSTNKRLSLICHKTDSMTYFVSVTGITGAREDLPIKSIKSKVLDYRSMCKKPVIVGFGVSNRDHVRNISSFADGVVVGSLLVKTVSQRNLELLGSIVRDLKAGTCNNVPVS